MDFFLFIVFMNYFLGDEQSKCYLWPISTFDLMCIYFLCISHIKCLC